MRVRAGWLSGLLLLVAACGGAKETGSAEPGVGPTTTGAVATTAASAGNAVSWSTEFVTLEADDFVIVAEGVEFYGAGPIEVSSDTPNSAEDPEGTLELTWTERGVEMRLYVYLEADDDGWRAYEIRTRDGTTDAEWIYYTGPFFETPRGEDFEGSLSLTSDPEKNEFPGEIRFTNLRLAPTFPGD